MLASTLDVGLTSVTLVTLLFLSCLFSVDYVTHGAEEKTVLDVEFEKLYCEYSFLLPTP